jgi:hypothetical protein
LEKHFKEKIKLTNNLAQFDDGDKGVSHSKNIPVPVPRHAGYLCPTLPKVNIGVTKNEKTTATPVFDRSLEDKTIQENKERLGENSLSTFCLRSFDVNASSTISSALTSDIFLTL